MRNFKNNRGGGRGRGRGRGGFRGNHHNKSNNFVKREKQEHVAPKNNLKEPQAGITEYVSDNKGFTGVLKSRFSDFHVSEIDLNGKVLQLDDFKVPQSQVEEGNFFLYFLIQI